IHDENSKSRNGRLLGAPGLQVCGFNMRWYDCGDGKGHCKRAAPTFSLTFRNGSSTMRLHQFADNRQAETEPAMSPARRAVRLSKPVENVRKKIRLDTFTVIDDLNLCVRSDASQANLNMPVLRCELHRIREKIRKDLLQPAGISYNDHRSGPSRHLKRNSLSVC